MSDIPLGQQLEAAFQAARSMDVPLSVQLDYVANAVRTLSEEFANGVDNLVARLHNVEAGEDAPRVGEKMPSFALPDGAGRIVNLDDELTKGPVAVVFNRGHWCPYCRLNTHALGKATRTAI